MKELQDLVRKVLPDQEELMNISAEDYMNHAALTIYRPGTLLLREPQVLSKLPLLVRDLVLLIDLDTELSMNGILGFLENSSSRFINETIELLERIQADADARVLQEIKSILEAAMHSTDRLHQDLQQLQEYQISSFMQTHDIDEADVDQIEQAAEGLYLHRKEANIFENLEAYIERNKVQLVEEVKTFLAEDNEQA
jgi:hypothetical protein